MKSRKVDFVVRDDSEVKGGGDLTQVEMYGAFLSKFGWDVRIVPFAPSMTLRPDAVVHLVNVDRPFDAIVTIRKARDRPVFVSAIHHSLSAIRRMRAAERGLGARSLVGRVLPESAREYLAFVVRSLRRSDGLVGALVVLWSALLLVPSIVGCWRHLGRALDGVEAVFLLAEGEGEHLRQDMLWSGRNGVLTPNGLPPTEEAAVAWEDREDVIVVVGRIEPRKRQLDIARAASRVACRIRMVGPLQTAETPFGKEFRSLVATLPNVEWTGGQSHEAVLREVASSKVLLNASWVEVQSLVELEAAARGTWVVASERAGNSAEYLGEGFVGVRNDDVGRMLEDAEALLGSAEVPPILDYPWSWEGAASRIEAEYNRSLVGRTARS
jgi:glycosyltransferase involved in cell wall biosynthesis